MFEAYVEMGVDNVGGPEIAKGFASFLVVALGGTVIGIIWGYVTGRSRRSTSVSDERLAKPLIARFHNVGPLFHRASLRIALSFLESSI